MNDPRVDQLVRAFGHSQSRRTAVRAGAAALAAASLAPAARAQDVTPNDGPDQDGLSLEIIEAFKVLPGQKGLRLWAPADAGRPAWSAEMNPDDRFFIASVFKGFVLAECLRLEEESLDPRSDTPSPPNSTPAWPSSYRLMRRSFRSARPS